MKRLTLVFALVLGLFSSFVPTASAQEQRPTLQMVPTNWVYFGRAVDIDGLPVAAIGKLKQLDPEGNNNYVASTVTDSYDNIWIAPETGQIIQDGRYDFLLDAEDFVMERRVLRIQNNQVVRGGGTVLMRPSLRGTSLEFVYDHVSGVCMWNVNANGRKIRTPVLLVETVIFAPGLTEESALFSIRQGQEYGAYTYASKVMDQFKTLSDDEQESWSPEDSAGIEVPTVSPDSFGYYLNRLDLKGLPAGEWVWGYVTITRADNRFNVRSNKHYFGFRIPPAGFTGVPTVYSY